MTTAMEEMFCELITRFSIEVQAAVVKIPKFSERLEVGCAVNEVLSALDRLRTAVKRNG